MCTAVTRYTDLNIITIRELSCNTDGVEKVNNLSDMLY